MGLPQCGIDQCKTANDCGAAPPKCVECANGTCASFECLENKCVFACPSNPEPECKVSEDCAALDVECKTCESGKCAIPACIKGSCELVCALP